MTYSYVPTGVCSRRIDLELQEDGTIESVQEAIRKLRGIRCGFKPTSCPDQLSLALEEALEEL